MTRKRLKSTHLVALLGVALLAAACGSSNNNSGTTSGSSGASSASSAGLARANALVASLSKPTTTFPAPGPALKNVKSLKGKTVWYIPISLAAPVFAIGNSSLHTALAKAGITDGMIRLSLGLESAIDLERDVARGLAAAAAVG